MFWRSCYARLLHSITTNALVAFTSKKAKRGRSNHLHPVSHRNWTIKERMASPTAREPGKQRIHSVYSHDGNPAARKPSSGHLCAAFISSVLADRRNYRWEPATRRMHCVNANKVLVKRSLSKSYRISCRCLRALFIIATWKMYKPLRK